MPAPDDTIIIRLLQEEDLPAADRIMRMAFGSFIGLPEPEKFMLRAKPLAD